MKVNEPAKCFLGHLYLEYIGSNLVLLNSDEGRYLQALTLASYKNTAYGEKARNCFKVGLQGKHFLIAFDGYLVFKLDPVDSLYKRDESSVLSYFETFVSKDLFMIVGKLLIYNEINASDHRHEPFKFNIVLKNSESLTNLFI
ncbi:hypothetical protein [Bizionia sp.]|uniref:hypothetical protein n=1 Tax=Bizionia sp. TaxID=1954480 RepID=UPI003A9504BF